jgi:hypothetical protein
VRIWFSVVSSTSPSAQAVAHGEGFESQLGQLAVGNADRRAIERSNACGAQPNALYRADQEPFCAHEIAFAEGLTGAERERAEQVLQRLLRPERDGEAADAEPREQARHRVAELRQERDDADREQEYLSERAG